MDNEDNGLPAASPCGYFEGRISFPEVYGFPTKDEAFAFLEERGVHAKGKEQAQLLMYEAALDNGFRRSGRILYRNTCPECRKCVPIRIPVEQFRFSKSQRHLLRKNADITITETHGGGLVTDEKVRLMARYSNRHRNDLPEDEVTVRLMLNDMNGIYLNDSGTDGTAIYAGTTNLDYYLDGKLVGCSLLDATENGLSSNYFYYDVSPDMLKRSLGTFSILREIAWCKEKGLKYYYLGYWIEDCRKMSYKANFKPHEILTESGWVTVEK